MKDKIENPLAFPIVTEGAYDTGMTLRDYFASAAMNATITGLWSTSGNAAHNWTAEEIAKNAYEIADAMLKARTNN